MYGSLQMQSFTHTISLTLFPSKTRYRLTQSNGNLWNISAVLL